MTARPPLVALGLMSGTSLDGIDAAVVRTDGERIAGLGPAATFAYDEPFRAALRGVLGAAGDDRRLAAVASDLTERHAEAVRRLIADNRLDASAIDVLGFHGQTVLHRPAQRLTRQIGDGDLLARLTGLPVVDDFRSRDVEAGGEGAPLAPLFHAALAGGLAKPLAVLNLGGVANLTWIGEAGEIVAFDTGPGNALIDDWVGRTAGLAFDEGGRLAAAGHADPAVVRKLLADPYFRRPPPKSLDRDDFAAAAVAGLSPADGAATLTAFTAQAVGLAQAFLPQSPRRWLVGGGGRRNRALIAALAAALAAPVEAVEAAGWQGDALEAQAFAFLAVRSLYRLPLSLPSTTGVARPTTGGTLHRPPGGGRPLPPGRVA